jgi:hypothetical protein
MRFVTIVTNLVDNFADRCDTPASESECVVIPSFVKELRAEEARLEAELQRLPLFRQLEAVRESLRTLLPAYGDDSHIELRPENATANVAINRPVFRRRTEPTMAFGRTTRQGSMSHTVSAIALEHFQNTGRRANSGQIVEILRQRGIEIDNKKPQAQVASILSHNPLFDNSGDHHGQGYGLCEWTEYPTDAAGHLILPDLPKKIDDETKETAHE